MSTYGRVYSEGKLAYILGRCSCPYNHNRLKTIWYHGYNREKRKAERGKPVRDPITPLSAGSTSQHHPGD